ncbi:MAG TPA: putative glycoside hydrolase [Acidimicrobiia bacterium]|nr:putative glycoside hydrolase [Acidimicrobiia bacterium]
MTQTHAPYPRATRPQPRPRYRLTRRGRIVFTVLPILLIGGLYFVVAGGGMLEVGGLEDNAVVGPDGAEATITVEEGTPAEELTVAVDEQPLSPTPGGGTGLYTVQLDDLDDGEHMLSVVVDRGFPFTSLKQTIDFSVDTTPPAIDILQPTEPVPVGDQVVVKARVGDASATVSIDGEIVAADEAGNVTKAYEEPPEGGVVITATDSTGNQAELVVPIELALPGAPGAPPIMGVHATGWTWATPELKDPIMDMVDAGLINTVELDLKDEAGDIWYDTEVQLAHEIGAVTELWDLADMVEELHDRGVRVIGRIVNFRDPRLATYAVESGNMDWVIQNPDGTAYGQYGGFTNPFNPEVREYNIALAEEAARLGVDDVMFDYVRRPDTLSELVYPGQSGPPEDAIVSFLSEAYDRVHSNGARLAAAVFGIAATRPEEVAQDIPRMAEEVDYIAPMVYPSHWGPGEYDVENPNAQPYDITYRSLVDFVEITEGTQAFILAWLQDFSLGVDYNEAEVRAQIDAARDAGVEHILLWDAATTYTRSALDPIE